MLARSIFPSVLRRAIRLALENLRDWLDAAVFGLRFVVSGKRLPEVLLFFGYAPGDDLLCTAVLRELRQRGRGGLLMVSNHGELFMRNPDPAYVRPFWQRHSPWSSTASICRRFVRIWGGQVVQIEYAPSIEERRRLSSRHVIAEFCAKAGIGGSVSIRPYISLSESEKLAAQWAKGYIAIQTSGRAARHPAQNKDWYADRYQKVVDVLREDGREFIQVGSADDPPLNGVHDLRGATTIREIAAILFHSRLYVGHEGFLMHLARAVECPSVIIFGGRTTPKQFGYICNANLYSPVPCSPCWLSNTCDFDRKCMRAISVDDVVTAVREMLAKPRNPLITEQVEIAPKYPDSQFR